VIYFKCITSASRAKEPGGVILADNGPSPVEQQIIRDTLAYLGPLYSELRQIAKSLEPQPMFETAEDYLRKLQMQKLKQELAQEAAVGEAVPAPTSSPYYDLPPELHSALEKVIQGGFVLTHPVVADQMNMSSRQLRYYLEHLAPPISWRSLKAWVLKNLKYFYPEK
jgi:hypothetical protein